MAELYIDFSHDDNLKRSINSARSKLATRINDYKGVRSSLSKMDSSTSNLSSANSYLKKKINSLEEKHDKLGDFKNAVDNFNDNASSADKRVANRIKDESKAFYKREGIKDGIVYTVCSVFAEGAEWLKSQVEEFFTRIVEGIKSTWEAVKKWYQENKYWIDIVIDAVVLVVAIAAAITSGGVLAAAFALWGVAKATADLCFDVAAYCAYKDGDMERYQELSNSGMKEIMTYYGGDFGTGLYYGMEIASAVYGIYKIGKEVNTLRKDFSTLYKKPTTAMVHLSKETKKSIIISDIKSIAFETIGIENLDKATGNLNFTNVLKAGKWTIKTVDNILTSDNVGSLTIKSISITDTISSGFGDIRNLVNTISGSKVAVSVPTAA